MPQNETTSLPPCGDDLCAPGCTVCRDDPVIDLLEAEIDKWVELEVNDNPSAVPDFWDECDTSGRLAEFLVKAGWRKQA